MKVELLAIEKYDISEIELPLLIKTFKIKYPGMFRPKSASVRNVGDYSGVLRRIEPFSRNMTLDLHIQIIPKYLGELIGDKFILEREIKESTFSQTLIVNKKV